MKLMVDRESDSGKKKGGRAGKTKATWKGQPSNILKRKHWLKSLRKESKGFARVGWILDYGLRLRGEKGRAGGKRKQLRVELAKTERVESL